MSDAPSPKGVASMLQPPPAFGAAPLNSESQGNGRDGREAIPIHAQSRKKTAPPVSNRKGGP